MQHLPTSPAELGAGFEQLFHANPQPMWIYDVETLAFLAVNDAAVERYGWSREEFLGMSIRDIRPQHDVLQVERFAADHEDGATTRACAT